ncbi:damage-control phosphatase ARMT1 family protein [Streptomyces sp. NPDC047108]|uniref:damage-control phosphatase ARMT1 family protein n=1 Tax=Streptomyces sp. NPDC047108 TaxID=3155025 RepID=UPI0033DC84B7
MSGSQGTPGAGGGQPPVVSNEPGSFPYGVWHERHPALFRRLKETFPFGPGQRRALDALLEETLSGVIEPLPETDHDHGLWSGPWDRGHYGTRWTDAPFLWAESYFYRRLLGAIGYFGPGPWQGIDPFGPSKDAELRSGTVDEELAALDTLGPVPADRTDSPHHADRMDSPVPAAAGTTRAAAPDEPLTDALLHAALWGNRADLGFLITANGSGRTDDGTPLVADDRASLHTLLSASSRQGGRVAVVADNAGRELIPDLVLADHLLTTGRAATVTLHIKPHPYYVSDATTADVLASLQRLADAPGRAGGTGDRLLTAMREEQLTLSAHRFFCAPLPYEDMPGDLRQDFASASLTILKGDLNYRRLVGDRHWPATTSFAEVTGHFPGPVAALRTLKSDVVTGLPDRTVAALDASGEEWRTNGRHALIQVRS